MLGNEVHRIGPSPAARRVSWWAAAGATAIGFWTLLWPYPYSLAILASALAPWAGVLIVKRFPELSLFGGERDDGAEELGMLWATPSLALAWRTFDHAICNAWLTAAAAILPGAVLWVAMMAADTQHRSRATMACAAVFAWAWGWGVLTYVDVTMAQPRFEFVVGVIDDIGATSRDEPTFDVTATVAGRHRTFEGLVVSNAVYASHPSGGPICLEVHRGLLGARYVYAAACPPL